MTMTSLTWQQVNAWRLAQQRLAPRLQRPDFINAVQQACGIQAQVMSAAELALWARVDGLTPQHVQSALWRDRTLVKSWAMRGTLHLLAAADFPIYISARNLHETRNWPSFFAYYGVSDAHYQAYLAAAPEVLGGEPMTRQRLALAMGEHTGSSELRTLLQASGWGTALKPLAWQGNLCFGPNQGQNVTYVSPRKWIGEWAPIEPYTALLEVTRRYLRTYGPATPQAFALWWGGQITTARKIFRSLADELAAVDVDGWQAFALRSTLEPIQTSSTSGSVNMLPLFDMYVMGLARNRELEPLLAKEYQRQIFRPQGWISAAILVDGYIKGVWEYAERRSHTVVTVRLFSVPTTAIQNGIDAEAERLSAFLNSNVVLECREA
jgi:hypothetical protein